MSSPPIKNADPTISKALSVGKGLGIVLVVIGHFDIKSIQPDYWTAVRAVIYTFHMPLFMALSGYLYAMKEKQKMNFPVYVTFLKKKAQRLLYPYVAVTSILLAVKIIAGKFFVLSYPVTSKAFYYIFLNPDGGFSTLLWFIYTLFVIFVLFPPLKHLMQNDLTLVMLTILLAFLPWPDPFCLNQAFHYLPFFSLGYFFQRSFFFTDISTFKRITVSLLLYGFCWAVRSAVDDSAVSRQAISLVLGLSGSVVCITLAFVIAGWQNPLSGGLTQLGIASSAIYLLHTLGMGMAKILLTQILHFGRDRFPLIIVAVVGAGLVVPLIANSYIISRSPTLARFIFGMSPMRNPWSSAGGSTSNDGVELFQ